MARLDGRGHRLLLRDRNIVDHLAPAWSPDGRRIAYVRGSNALELVVADLQSGRRQRFVFGDGESVFLPGNPPSWSSDGRQLLAVVQDDLAKFFGIYAVDVASGTFTLVLKQPYGGGINVPPQHPVWAPDGSKIAFFRRLATDEDRARLAVMNADGSGVRDILITRETQRPRITGGGSLDWQPQR